VVPVLGSGAFSVTTARRPRADSLRPMLTHAGFATANVQSDLRRSFAEFASQRSFHDEDWFYWLMAASSAARRPMAALPASIMAPSSTRLTSMLMPSRTRTPPVMSTHHHKVGSPAGWHPARQIPERAAA
jgi:hypothetical protein